MRATDLFFAFPPLVLAMAITAALGPSLTNAVIAAIVVWWPTYARLVRGPRCCASARTSTSRRAAPSGSPTAAWCSATCCPRRGAC